MNEDQFFPPRPLPDLPGCVAAGETREEVLELIREAIDFYIEGLRKRRTGAGVAG